MLMIKLRRALKMINRSHNEIRSFEESDEEVSSENWNPSPETFNNFLKRDFVLAGHNMNQVLRNASEPLLFREIKECLLHSTDVVERVLVSKIASGNVVEEKGHYHLVK
jgi:hypothetical protein